MKNMAYQCQMSNINCSICVRFELLCNISISSLILLQKDCLINSRFLGQSAQCNRLLIKQNYKSFASVSI